MQKRPIDILVLSDIHLGTYGCHAEELLQYLNSVTPKIMILNGDIIDIWQFKKRYFPKTHLAVISQVLQMAAENTKVYYLTGNHDEMLRKFAPFALGNFFIDNKLLLKIDQKTAWFFHGDVFDSSISGAKWLAKLGGFGYDLLVLINRIINKTLKRFGRPPMSLSKKVKNSVKQAIKFINNFESTAAELAIEQGYNFVGLGHIHQPAIREIKTHKGTTTYLNSGDWIENLTALEYNNQKWTLYKYKEQDFNKQETLNNMPANIDIDKLYASVTDNTIQEMFETYSM